MAIGSSRDHLRLVQKVCPHWLQLTIDNDVMAKIFDADLKKSEIWQTYMSPTILQAWHEQSKRYKLSNNRRNQFYKERE